MSNFIDRIMEKRKIEEHNSIQNNYKRYYRR